MDIKEYLLAQDTISGQEGQVLATINGRKRVCAEIKSLKAKLDKTKHEVKTLGHRATQHKATGWKGTGTVSFHYVTSEWARMIIDYAKTGADVYFDMLVVNEDPTSKAGRQTVHLMQCNLDGADVANIDVDANSLDGSFNFTFSDIDLADAFNEFPYR